MLEYAVAPAYYRVMNGFQSRRLAEDEIIVVLDMLTVPDQLAALAECAAKVLADNHIVAGQPAFDAYLQTYTAAVAQRTRLLHRERHEGAN